MFEAHIAHGRELIDRLSQCRDHGFANVPSSVPVSNEEYFAWYDGLERLIANRFGQASEELKRWWELLVRRSEMVSIWIDGHPSGTSTEVPYLNHLQTCLAFLNSLDERPAMVHQEAPAQEEPKVPPTITVPWLLEHVPVLMWFAAAGILASAYVLGVQSTRISFVREVFHLDSPDRPSKATQSQDSPSSKSKPNPALQGTRDETARP